MATNNDIYEMLNSIRASMATKLDMSRLQKEVSELRDENESQKDHIRCLRADIANMRTEIDELRAAARDEVCEGIEQVKEDVVRWGVSTQGELWEQESRAKTTLEKIEALDKKVHKSLVHIERGVGGLVVKEIRRMQGEMDERGNVFLLGKRFDKVQNDLRGLSSEVQRLSRERQDAPRKDSGVLLADKCEPLPMSFGFANGY